MVTRQMRQEEAKMANKYAGTKTEQNLLAAFAGEQFEDIIFVFLQMLQ